MTRRPVGVDALERGRHQLAEERGRRVVAGRIGEQLGLQRQVDRAAGDVEGELLRRDVVLEQGHRERERDPGRQALGMPADVAVDDLAGERPTLAIDAGDAEQPQERALPAERRGARGGRHAPASVSASADGESRGGARARAAKSPVPPASAPCERAGCGPGVSPRGSGPSRAGRAPPIQTWPSANRSAFQIGARAFVSSIA